MYMQGGEGRILGFSLIAPRMWGGGESLKAAPLIVITWLGGEVDIGGLFVQHVLSNAGTLWEETEKKGTSK